MVEILWPPPPATPSGTLELHDTTDTVTHEVNHAGHTNKAYVSILFCFVMLTLGAFCRTQLAGTSVPYTLVLLLVGLVVGMVSHWADLGYLEGSIDQWASIDPHLLLFAFLPGLVFESSFNLEWHTLSKCLGQVIVLAGPGVLTGMSLLGAFCKWVLPYGWSWEFSLTVGAVLCATDPVAVVALLRDLGASKKLSTVIEGESLFNDGTAIVVFKLFFELAKGATYSPIEIVVFFLQVPLGGVAVGLAAALGTLYWLGHTFNDAMVDISLTVTSCYLTFFVAEEVCEASGVLAVVTLGAYLGAVGKPFFQVRKEIEETLHHFWEMASYVANTIIFILAGVIIGRMFVETSDNFTAVDAGWLLLFYVWMNVARGLMIFILYPLLQRIGYGLDWQNATVMSWGGLRGAVGLALALVVSLEKQFPEKDRARVMFLTGGVVVLTLVVNGTTTASLLNYLNLNPGSANKERALANMRHELREMCMKGYLDNFFDETLGGASFDTVKDYVSTLDRMPGGSVAQATTPGRSTRKLRRVSTVSWLFGNSKMVNAPGDEEVPPPPLASDEERIADVRSRFLQTVKHEYTVLLESGNLEMNTSLTLVASVDSALDRTHEPLRDWEMLQAEFNSSGIWVGVKLFAQLLPAKLQNLLSKHNTMAVQEANLQAAVAFMTAHRTAAQHVVKSLERKATTVSGVVKEVILESNHQCDEATSYISEVKLCFPEIAALIKTKEVTRQLLYRQIEYVKTLSHQGVFEQSEIGKMMSVVEHDLKTFLYNPPAAPPMDSQAMLRQVPLIKSLGESSPLLCQSVLGQAVPMTLMPGNLLLKPDSAEDRVILLTRGVVSLDIKDRSGEHPPVQVRIGSRSHPGGWVMGLDHVLLKENAEEDMAEDYAMKRFTTTAKAATLVVGHSLPGDLVRSMAAEREKEGNMLWIAAASIMLETTLRNDLGVPLTATLQRRLAQSPVERLPETLEVSDLAVYILVQGAVFSSDWGEVYAPALLSHNTGQSQMLAKLGGHIHFTLAGKATAGGSGGTTNGASHDTHTFTRVAAGRYIKVPVDMQLMGHVQSAVAPMMSTAELWGTTSAQEIQSDEAVQDGNGMQPSSPLPERAYARTFTARDFAAMTLFESSANMLQARRQRPFGSDPSEPVGPPNMHRIPSRVVEEEEAMDVFPTGKLVRASTEGSGGGQESDVRRTLSEYPSHAEYRSRPRSSSTHASSGLPLSASKASSFTENNV